MVKRDFVLRAKLTKEDLNDLKEILQGKALEKHIKLEHSKRRRNGVYTVTLTTINVIAAQLRRVFKMGYLKRWEDDFVAV